ncbi:MAG: ThuA domain-containing protein [Limisphaerales bacterium]
MRAIALVLTLVAVQCWGAEKPRIVFIAGEYEYHSKETLPPFAAELEKDFDVTTVMLERPEDTKVQSIPGLEKLAQADLAVLYVRRMTLPENELAEIRKYVESGKPLVALRTSSHAFENWKEFDKEVLGGNYGNHYGNKLKTTVSVAAGAKDHPLLRGVSEFVSDGSLYKNTPLGPGAKVLLMGAVEGHAPEPVAWTRENKGARVFYTSLGHPQDFKEESFRNLVRNGIEWGLQKPLRKKEAGK